MPTLRKQRRLRIKRNRARRAFRLWTNKEERVYETIGFRESYYDRQGRPIRRRQWMRMRHNPEYKYVGYDHVGDLTISTIWLGSDHSAFLPQSQPVLFETVVFNAEMEPIVGPERYRTEAEAIEGHAGYIRIAVEAQSNSDNDAVITTNFLKLCGEDDVDVLRPWPDA